MESRYDVDQAAAYVDRYSPLAPRSLADPESRRDLALRVYTSQLLGQDPSLVLHGGGNTSLKTQARDFTGRALDCLCVKGSGWDLAAIEPAGFPVCRLEALRELCQLDTLSDADMVAALRGQMLDPSSPTPSVEALLHAYLPAKFVDHTHADAVLALVDQPDAEAHVRRVWGDEALFVPYIMPGFVLLRRIVELTRNATPGAPMVLEKHGIFTWGETARESYERMVEAVSRAEAYLSTRGAGLTETMASHQVSSAPERQRVQRSLTPWVRGALARAAAGEPCLLAWQDDPATLQLAAHPQADELTQRGPLTPDHVIRTKQRPLFVPSVEWDSGALFPSKLGVLLERYQRDYSAYFERCRAHHPTPVEQLDPLPRLLLFPGLGALSVGRNLKAAHVVRELYQHTAQVVLAASKLGRDEPVSEQELFEVEYWSLEQAKLKRAQNRGSFDGRVALVTGGARGIGLATARRLLEAGAHVMLSDRDPDALKQGQQALAAEFGSSRVIEYCADVRETAQVEALLDGCVAAFGGLDIVISNAGSAPSGLLHETEGDRALRDSIALNLLGHQNVARAASQLLIRQGMGGCLLFNASKSAFNQGPEFGPYAVAKAALVALMRQYAVDLAKHGIRTGAVNADRVRTALFGGGVLEARAKARGVSTDAYFQQNLLSRETLADDVAQVFCWLSNAQATTGAVVPVDGGNAAAFPR